MRRPGIAITLFQPFRDFEGCRRDRLQKNLDRAERKFDLMQELGTDLVLVCSNVRADALSEEQLLVDDLRLLAEHAGKRGLRIGYEATAGAATSIPTSKSGTWCARLTTRPSG